jgi:hypothetical protein
MIPGGIGLLYLARGLAIERCGATYDAEWWLPAPRRFLDERGEFRITREYYAILDRIARGEKP